MLLEWISLLLVFLPQLFLAFLWRWQNHLYFVLLVSGAHFSIMNLFFHHWHINLVSTYLSFNLPGHMTVTLSMKFILWQLAELLTVLVFITSAFRNPKTVFFYACAAVDEYTSSNTVTRLGSIFYAVLTEYHVNIRFLFSFKVAVCRI